MKAHTNTNTNTEDMIMAIQDEIRRTEEARYDHRLHAMLLVAQGQSCREVGKILGDAPRTVAYWANKFEKEGFAGLVGGERPGRPRRLTKEQLATIETALRKDPGELGLQGLWDGKALSCFIQERWGISLGVRQCQRLFRQLGLRLHKPRPRIAHAGPAQQAEYKKIR
jgi:transposase